MFLHAILQFQNIKANDMRYNVIYLSTAIVLNFCLGMTSIAAQDSLLNWKFTKGDRYHATPLHHGKAVFIGGMDGYFYAIDMHTGVEKWKFNSGQPILSTALVQNDQLFFVSGGKIFALKLSDGTELWSHCSGEQSSKAQIDAWDYHHSSPYILDNVVYYGDDWGNLNGVNVTSGELVFRYTTDNKRAIRSTPVIQDGVLFFGDYAGITHAVNTIDSTLLWSHNSYEKLPYEGFGMSDSRFVVYKGGLYFGSRNPEYYCLDIKDGHKKWSIKDKMGSWMSGSTVIHNDTLYFGASDNHLFYAIEPLTGDILWTHKASVNIFTIPLLIENYICFGTVNSYDHDAGEGSLIILNRQTGELVSKYLPECNILSSPVKVGENIVFGTSKGEVLALKSKLLLDSPKAE